MLIFVYSSAAHWMNHYPPHFGAHSKQKRMFCFDNLCNQKTRLIVQFCCVEKIGARKHTYTSTGAASAHFFFLFFCIVTIILSHFVSEMRASRKSAHVCTIAEAFLFQNDARRCIELMIYT